MQALFLSRLQILDNASSIEFLIGIVGAKKILA